jgi:hypothetical protein
MVQNLIKSDWKLIPAIDLYSRFYFFIFFVEQSPTREMATKGSNDNIIHYSLEALGPAFNFFYENFGQIYSDFGVNYAESP